MEHQYFVAVINGNLHSNKMIFGTETILKQVNVTKGSHYHATKITCHFCLSLKCEKPSQVDLKMMPSPKLCDLAKRIEIIKILHDW